MNLERASWIAGAALLGVAFAVSAVRVAGHRARESDREVLRIAHYHLEPGVREALEEAGRAYEAQRPGVDVEWIAVPPRLYLTWLRTRLAGGDAPDLVEMMGDAEEILPRYFAPLGREIAAPNPWEPGDGRPWRDRFLDGLAAQPSYSYNLLENYAIPLATSTVRMYVNRDLYRELLGDRPYPETLEDFLAAARAAAAAPGTPRGFTPFAGARAQGDQLLAHVFAHLTQRRTLDLEPTRRQFAPGLDWRAAYLAGRWGLRDPDVLAGLATMRELGRHFPPGFLQLQPEDALLAFAQRRALFLVGSSGEAGKIRGETRFAVDVIRVPVPPPGEHTLGPIAELAPNPPGAFLVTRGPRSDLAVDLLRFLTSRAVAARLAAGTGWPPAVEGVSLPPELAIFEPVADGYPPGLVLTPGAHSSRVHNQNLHRLLDPEGSVEAYLESVAAPYADAMRADVVRGVEQILRNVAILDPVLGAAGRADDPALRERAALVSESQTLQEEASYRRAFLERRSRRAAAGPAGP